MISNNLLFKIKVIVPLITLKIQIKVILLVIPHTINTFVAGKKVNLHKLLKIQVKINI